MLEIRAIRIVNPGFWLRGLGVQGLRFPIIRTNTGERCEASRGLGDSGRRVCLEHSQNLLTGVRMHWGP